MVSDGRHGHSSSTTAGGYSSGTTGQGLTGGGTGYSGTTTGEHGHHGRHGHGEDIIHGGPHHTETANKLDPLVSGRGPTESVGVHGSGLGTSHGTTGGTTTGVTTTGGTTTGGTTIGGTTTGGTTTGGTTTGPHKSNILNKLDPRSVDLIRFRPVSSNVFSESTRIAIVATPMVAIGPRRCGLA